MTEADERGKAPAGGGATDVPLPGGGVLHREDAAAEADLPVSLEAIAKPFFLMGLAALGVIPHPEHGTPTVDLPAARLAIAALELLRDKTAGNLSVEESRMLEQALLELKMQYVEVRGA